MNFIALFHLARQHNTNAVGEIIEMYKPLMIRESIVNGAFDEDLYQELVLLLLACIRQKSL